MYSVAISRLEFSVDDIVVEQKERTPVRQVRKRGPS